MKKILLILLIITNICCGCEPREMDIEKENTLLFFFPWSTNLTYYFKSNIRDFENALSNKETKNTRVVVFISETDTTACCYEIKWSKKGIKHDTIAQFANYNYDYTSIDGLTKVINMAKCKGETKRFAMIIGCHGDAWIPAKDMKKSFGGGVIESRIDITTLRQALENSNLTTEYILFDDCYMSSIEVAYELRNVCNYLIASPTELMAAGMPYSLMAKELIEVPNYETICSTFYNYYASHSSTPYGAIAVTKCSELDSLARIIKNINKKPISATIQIYDGNKPHLFYDLGDYIDAVCQDKTLKTEFSAQLQKTVPYKAHTERVYVYGFDPIIIKKYSGLSTSEPSKNNKCASWKETSWAKATN